MTFLLFDFSREVMTSKRLSIHISNDNIYTFMIDQQNEILLTYQKGSHIGIHLKNI